MGYAYTNKPVNGPINGPAKLTIEFEGEEVVLFISDLTLEREPIYPELTSLLRPDLFQTANRASTKFTIRGTAINYKELDSTKPNSKTNFGNESLESLETHIRRKVKF